MTSANSTFDYVDFLQEKSYSLRSLFYLLTPRETYFEKEEQVPDVTLNALGAMVSLMIVEQLVFLAKYGRFNGRTNDSITSLGSAIVMTLPNFISRKLALVSYEWVYNNFRIFDLPYDSIWVYILTFLFVDMMYYWFHRAAHEVNVFWAAHQMHHSSEEYNLTTAMRQSVFQQYTSFFFYMPLGLFVRPSIFMVHSHLNLIYQFWIHTEVIDNIGPLEYVLNTPSHHRVHHGRNPYCIDKNYAGVLIIFDRMFGTFTAEKKDEEIAYGLVHPLKTFDPIYVQTFNYRFIYRRLKRCKSWSERLSVIIKGPGWEPGSPRLGHHHKLPQVKYPIKKYHVDISAFLNIYVVLHFAYTMLFFSGFVKQLDRHPAIMLSGAVFLILYTLTCFGKIFDAKENAFVFETVRCFITIVVDAYYSSMFKELSNDSETVYRIFKWMTIISLNIMFILAVNDFIHKKPKPPAAVKTDAAKKSEVKSN